MPKGAICWNTLNYQNAFVKSQIAVLKSADHCTIFEYLPPSKRLVKRPFSTAKCCPKSTFVETLG